MKAVLPETLRATVELQLATGARSGEILKLRPCDIECSGPVWTVDLSGKHKSAHRDRERFLYLGPRAQEALRPLLRNRGPEEYLFSPREALTQRKAACRTHRREHQKPNQRATERVVGEFYDAHSYRKAIARACKDAHEPEFHPHRLRHTAATAIRKEFGLEGAQIILGHAKADVTQLYAESQREKAEVIAQELG